MPDRRVHRGPHPEDAVLFAPAAVPRLRAAAHDLSWLLSRGYAGDAAGKLVGDRFQLAARQRVAVRRCACSDEQLAHRSRTAVALTALAGERVVVDGFNVLTTLEAAFAGGVVLRGRDGCWRDMASMHGSWKRVQETAAAVALVASALAAAQPAAVRFVLDRPVANSGRLAALIRAATRGLPDCEVSLADSADRALLHGGGVIATADSGVLDRAARWVDLVGPLLSRLPREVWLVELMD